MSPIHPRLGSSKRSWRGRVHWASGLNPLKFGMLKIWRGSSYSRRERVSEQSWYCQTSSLQLTQKRIAGFAAEAHVPTMFGLRDGVDAGGLMAYGPNRPACYRQAAVYGDKILRGARPGALPIQQPTTFELVINLKTAKAFGVTVPQSLLGRADQVIE